MPKLSCYDLCLNEDANIHGCSTCLECGSQICVDCVKNIQKSGQLRCPFCRAESDRLAVIGTKRTAPTAPRKRYAVIFSWEDDTTDTHWEAGEEMVVSEFLVDALEKIRRKHIPPRKVFYYRYCCEHYEDDSVYYEPHDFSAEMVAKHWDDEEKRDQLRSEFFHYVGGIVNKTKVRVIELMDGRICDTTQNIRQFTDFAEGFSGGDEPNTIDFFHFVREKLGGNDPDYEEETDDEREDDNPF